jgi:ABC-2 type transport system ATP-binding protein
MAYNFYFCLEIMLIDSQHIVKQYSGQPALDNISIAIPENSIYGLLGPNGAGKTTFIRILTQIIKQDRGTIFFKGKEIKSSDTKFIGYLPEERGLYKKMKVGEHLIYLARLKGLSKTDAAKAAGHWLEKLQLESRWNSCIEELSKGMQQKVQFIATVLHNPELLIFDEPFSGFDPLNTNMLKQEILELRKKGATIIFSTHNMVSVEELCDTISLLNKAKVVLQGNVHEIRKQFREHSFIIKTENEIPAIKANSLFEVTDTNSAEGMNFFKVKLKSPATTNELLSEIMKYCSVSSFEEELPGMSDVFIKVINGGSDFYL